MYLCLSLNYDNKNTTDQVAYQQQIFDGLEVQDQGAGRFHVC